MSHFSKFSYKGNEGEKKVSLNLSCEVLVWYHELSEACYEFIGRIKCKFRNTHFRKNQNLSWTHKYNLFVVKPSRMPITTRQLWQNMQIGEVFWPQSFLLTFVC